jgi:hypothetical protein
MASMAHQEASSAGGSCRRAADGKAMSKRSSGLIRSEEDMGGTVSRVNNCPEISSFYQPHHHMFSLP